MRAERSRSRWRPLEAGSTPFHSSSRIAATTKGALLCAAILFPGAPGLAQDAPFSDLEGSWIGSGAITTTNGRSEQIRCRAKYFAAPSGQSLDQQLRCASDTYRFDVDSGLVRQSNGAIAGEWTETNRKASGSVRARQEGDTIVAKITGPGFTADMTVATRGDDQRVEIIPNGSDVKSVAMDMHRQ
jgi:hypothetical protein